MKLIKLIQKNGATYEFPTSEISYLSSKGNNYYVALKHNNESFTITKKQYQALRTELADSIGVTNIREPIMSITPDGTDEETREFMAKMDAVNKRVDEKMNSGEITTFKQIKDEFDAAEKEFGIEG